MNYKKIGKDHFLIFCFNQDINIFDISYINDFIQQIVTEILVSNNLVGIFSFDFYMGHNEDFLVDITKVSDGDNIDIKIHFWLNNCFLREIDVISFSTLGKVIYYYRGKFYTETSSLGLDVLYGEDSQVILEHGIKIRN